MDANVKNLQDAMEWLDRNIREEAELEGEMSNCHAIELGFIQNMLAKFPRRNCDVGTAEEQTNRYRKFCSAHQYLGSDFSYMCKGFGKGRCPFFNSHTKSQCEFAWSQMPYEEGGAK